MQKEIDVNFLPTFNKMLKKFNLPENTVKRRLINNLQKYVDENPESYYFPKSGAGIGNVWKIRVGNKGEYRAIYFALPKSRHFDFILIFPKSRQGNLSAEQIKIIKKIIKGLEG